MLVQPHAIASHRPAHPTAPKSRAAFAASAASRPPSTGDVTLEFRKQFRKLASDPARFNDLMRTAFGTAMSPTDLESLRRRTLAGDFRWMPEVRWASAAEIGAAYGAYDGKANVVYLHESLRYNPALASKVYSEEAGHALDARLNRTDSPGDEGELFRRLLYGESLSAARIAAIRAENDHGVVRIGGREIAVENFLGSIAKGLTKACKGIGRAVGGVARGARRVVKGLGRRVVEAGKFLFKNLHPVQALKTVLATARNVLTDGPAVVLGALARGFSAMVQTFGPAAGALFRRDFGAFGRELLRLPRRAYDSAIRLGRNLAADVASLVPGARQIVEPGSRGRVTDSNKDLARIANAAGGSRSVPGFKPLEIPGTDGASAHGFRARAFLSADGKRLVVAFGGTDGLDYADMSNNLEQAAGGVPPQYRMAMEFARLAKAEATRRGATLEITGHSLGGGLAQAAGLAVGARTATFNASGLGSGVRRELGSRVGRHAGLVTNYVLRGEFLDAVDPNDRIGRSVYVEPQRGSFWSQVKSAARTIDPRELLRRFFDPLATRHSMDAMMRAIGA